MTLGERICKLRTERNLSQGDLAEALDVSRQSISKWETNSSVPELDKLVKLSELFEISLDELVRDKKPTETLQPEQKVIYVEKAEAHFGKKIVGTVLLCFAVLIWLMVSLFGDVLAGLLLASPFLACGLICLLVRHNIGLWCCWVVYLFISLYMRFATGANWAYVLVPQMYDGSWTVHLIIAWTIFLAFGVLTLITVLRFRKTPVSTLKTNAIATAVSWAAYFAARFISMPPVDSGNVDVDEIMLYRFASSAFGWIREILFVAALVYALRLLTSLLNKRSKREETAK